MLSHGSPRWDGDVFRVAIILSASLGARFEDSNDTGQPVVSAGFEDREKEGIFVSQV
jgi:hypothetical protein